MKQRILYAGLSLGLFLALPTAAFAQDAPGAGGVRVSPFGPAQDAAPSTTLLQRVRAVLPGWGVRTDPRSGSARVLYGPAVAVPGTTPEARGAAVFTTYGPAADLRAEDWVPAGGPVLAPKATYLRYRGVAADGRPVAFSRLDFRFSADGRLQRITARQYGSPAAGLSATLSATDATTSATAGLPGSITVSTRKAGADWVWFPLPSEGGGGYTLRPAWPFVAEGRDEEKGLPVRLSGYVDAVTGAVLYRTNEVETDVDLTVKASVYKTNYVTPATVEPLQDLEVSLAGTMAITDSAGLATAPGATGPVNAVMTLRGPWSVINDVPSTSSTVPLFTPADTAFGVSGTGVTVHTIPAGPSPLTERHLNAFYHVNVVHDHMKKYMPLFTDLDFPLTTNIDQTGTCNAYFNGTSINFFPAGGGCVSFALIGDIVYHEYGHAITNYFYGSFGESFDNGALGEGYSDVWGFTITADAVLGRGATGGTSSFIRRYDVDPKVYPQDIEGEVHADGEIIAGAWWDTYQNLGSLDTTTQLFAATHYALPNGPDGAEGEVYFDVLIAALEADDDDADITNGTPHFAAIVDGFARHGILLLGDAQLLHTEVANAAAGAAVEVVAEPVVSVPAFFGGVTLFYRVRGTAAYDSLVMAPVSGSPTYTATIPGTAASSIVDYYFRMEGLSMSSGVIFPQGFVPAGVASNLINIPYQFGVGLGVRFREDFNIIPAAGWLIGNNAGDAATAAGRWIQAVPVGSSGGGVPVQTGEDHTPGAGGACLVTGNGLGPTSPIGAADVDGGLTSVVSPMFSIAGLGTPVLEYWRWYSNNRGDNPGTDVWRVQVRGSATGVWQNVDNTVASDATWRRRILSLRAAVPSGDSFQVRFLAQDATPASVVEAAVDDMAVYDLGELGLDGIPAALRARIFPNPAHAALYITLPAAAGGGSVVLYNATGAVVYRAELAAGAPTHTLSTRALPEGLYLLSVRTAGGIQTERVVVRH